MTTCRKRVGSPIKPAGTSLSITAISSELLRLGDAGENLDGTVDDTSQVELDSLQFELARLDLGEVEDVVDQREQRLRGALGRMGKAGLLGIEPVSRGSARSC